MSHAAGSPLRSPVVDQRCRCSAEPCVLEVPAVATRCGWCTSVLGEVERAADRVPVES